MFTSWRQVFPTWVHKFLSWKHKIHRYEKTNLQAGENKSVGAKKNPRSTSLGDWEYQKFPKKSSSSSNSGADPITGLVCELAPGLPSIKRTEELKVTIVISGFKYSFFILNILFYFRIYLNYVRARSRLEMQASSHFSHLITNFLPFLIYKPFAGWLTR